MQFYKVFFNVISICLSIICFCWCLLLAFTDILKFDFEICLKWSIILEAYDFPEVEAMLFSSSFKYSASYYIDSTKLEYHYFSTIRNRLVLAIWLAILKIFFTTMLVLWLPMIFANDYSNQFWYGVYIWTFTLHVIQQECQLKSEYLDKDMTT